MESARIIIIGGGVAGLVAAQHLEQRGLRPTLIEATECLGGRIKTDEVAGFKLDHGFQVLLTAYREAQNYLDYDALELAYFRPGAVVFRNGRAQTIVDPLREPTQLLQAAFSPVGSLKDKFLIFKLTQSLKRTAVADIFGPKQESSQQFLRNYGFSEDFISSFFQPFFGGIFLENELQTPAPMLQFVFKMFATGYAGLPAAGMKAIPQQLAGKLKQTQIRLNTRVKTIRDGQVLTEAGESLAYDAVIIATAPDQLLPRLAGGGTTHHSTTTLYYRSNESVLPKGLISLVNEADSMVNNFCEPSSVSENYASEQQHLVSVTLKDIPTSSGIEEQVVDDLRKFTSNINWQLEPIGRYDISRALPQLEHLTYDYSATQARLTEDIFLAGDQLLFGSLDAAMRSGRRAAEGVVEALNR